MSKRATSPGATSSLTRMVARVARSRRLAMGLSQREVGDRIGATKNTVNNFENIVRSNMTLDLLERIAGALETTTVALIREAASMRFVVHGDLNEEAAQ